MNDATRHIPVQIKLPTKKAKGGLATAARDVAGAGEDGDTMLVHVNKYEFDELRKNWGEPTINEQTGLPSYSWGSWLGPIAGVVAGATGLGGWAGDAIGSATGLFEGGSNLSSALGSALIGGGVGALTGGGKGALYGGLAGGATPYALSALGLGGPGGLGGSGLSSMFGGGASAAAEGFKDTGALQGPTTSGATLDAVKGGSGGGGGLFDFSGKNGGTKALMMGLVAANALGAGRGPSADAKAAAAQNQQAQQQFNTPLPQVNFSRTINPVQGDPKKYGFGPQQQQFTNNGLGFARGGHVGQRPPPMRPAPMGPGGQRMPGLQQAMAPRGGAVAGRGTGRSDEIPAMLSDGEFVVDAETVALLGDGSPKAGAAKLDQMRGNIRKHKGGALAQGKISPNAAPPEKYLGGKA